MAETKFDPSATGDIYKEMIDAWTLNLAFGEMDLASLRAGAYLDEFGGKSAEASSQLAWRKNASFAIDHCQDLINLRVDNLFRCPPVRKYEDSPHAEFIDSFLADIDGGGTAVDNFMRRALRLHYINGVDFVVDKQSMGGAEPLSIAQERELNLAPYVHAFSPIERLDWSADHAGRFRWARYDLGDEGSQDELSSGDAIRRYLTILPNEWRLYEVATMGGKTATTETAGIISLGVCPIVPFYFKESVRGGYAKTPLSLLTRIAPIARYLLNLISQIQIDMYRNIAFMVATGVEADRIPTEITPMGCWALPEGAELNPVAGDVAHITSKIEFAQMLMEAILRIGKLTGATGELKSRATSGFQVEAERTDLDNEMRQTATQLEQVEAKIVQYAVSRHMGEMVSLDDIGYSVEYNKKYVLTPVGEIIKQLGDLTNTGVQEQVPELLKITLRKLLDALTKEGDASYEAAIAEIEESDFALMVSESPPPAMIAGEEDRRNG